ncbi:MAG: hypothetical protein ACXWF8_01675 [Methylobacter sp.]
MIDQADTQTADLFPVKRGRGRPVTGKAKTNAERMRAYRLRKKQRQTVARIDDIQAGIALTDSVYDRLDELEKLVVDLAAERDQLKEQVVELKSKVLLPMPFLSIMLIQPPKPSASICVNVI